MARRVDVFLQPRNFRLRIALALAAISLVSAYVSYVAGERAGIAADLDALASQQWAEEQQVQQQIDAVVAQDQRITGYLDQDAYAMGAMVEDAEAARTEDPERAAQWDLGAQAAVARYAQLFAFLRAGAPNWTSGVGVYDADDARIAALNSDWRLFRVSSEQTRDEADRAAQLTTYTVLVVVILVSALFLLTLAHVAGGRRGLWLASLGAASALGGIVYFATLDLAAALPILAGATAVAFALMATRIPRVHRWLEGMERDDIVGDVAAVPTRPGATASTNPSDPPTSRFTRYIAIAIAVATLLGAGVGYLHGRASSSSDDEAWRARDLGVEAIGALRSAEEALAVQIDSYQLALSAHVDAWDAAQRASYAAWSGDTAEADRMTREAGKFDELAQRHEERSELADDLGSAGVSSEALRDVRAEVWEASARLAALQDAANAASRAWGARAGAYLSVLAWLAVAAYLLGLSLIFRDRRVRQVLASVGTGADPRRRRAERDGPRRTRASLRYAGGGRCEGVRGRLRCSSPAGPGRSRGAIRHGDRRAAGNSDWHTANEHMHSCRRAAHPASGSARRSPRPPWNEAIAGSSRPPVRIAPIPPASPSTSGRCCSTARSRPGSMADMEQSLRIPAHDWISALAYEDEHGAPHLNQLIGEMNLGLALLGTGDVLGRGQRTRTVRSASGSLCCRPTSNGTSSAPR